MGYQVSKWLYQRALLTPQELKALFEELGHICLFRLGKILPKEDLELSLNQYIFEYKAYLEGLSKEEGEGFPAVGMTCDREAMEFSEVRQDGWLAKPQLPIVQMRQHTFIMTMDGRLQSSSYSASAIRFGIEFAYPQLFVDPTSQKIVEIRKEERYSNNEIFMKLTKWMRNHTKPTPILWKDKKINATFRLGKSALPFVVDHADLKREQINIVRAL